VLCRLQQAAQGFPSEVLLLNAIWAGVDPGPKANCPKCQSQSYYSKIRSPVRFDNCFTTHCNIATDYFARTT
jgi:hypothetical protein